MKNRLGEGFRTLLSGEPDGRPDWIQAIGEGSDEGLFGPGSAAWAVHGDLATLVGGVRALLMQTLQPGALAGVQQHSRYQHAPIDRLRGTTRWLVTLTFGDTALAERETARVRGMHKRVRGTYNDPVTGDATDYSGSDPHLLRWVHVAFTDSFLSAHQRFGSTPIPGGPDQYVLEWGVTAKMLGLPDPPESVAELRDQIASFGPELAVTGDSREVLRFLRNPPLPIATRPAYQGLLAAAVTTMPADQRALLGLKALPHAVVDPVVRAMYAGLRVALGTQSPSEQAARERIDVEV